MNFQQLRSVREATRRGYNLTEVAQALDTSQPGVSRQIRELEHELGVDIFQRFGKRLTGLTAPGAAVLPIVERMMMELENLRRASADFASRGQGRLVVAATHSQARYALPPAVREFRRHWPDVVLQIHQGTPQQVAQLLTQGQADVGVATEALADYDDLVALPAQRWSHVVVVPQGHALVQGRAAPLTLAQLAAHPIITYEPGYTGRAHIDEAFRRCGLSPQLALQAMDADVIKTYVELGLGVGIVASIAYDAERDRRLAALDAEHLFAANMTRVGLRRGTYLRDYVYAFVQAFAPPLTRSAVQQALAGPPAEDAAPALEG